VDADSLSLSRFGFNLRPCIGEISREYVSSVTGDMFVFDLLDGVCCAELSRLNETDGLLLLLDLLATEI
jgi:hypothetical protein